MRKAHPRQTGEKWASLLIRPMEGIRRARNQLAVLHAAQPAIVIDDLSAAASDILEGCISPAAVFFLAGSSQRVALHTNVAAGARVRAPGKAAHVIAIAEMIAVSIAIVVTVGITALVSVAVVITAALVIITAAIIAILITVVIAILYIGCRR
jgi:hypothetical protein